VKDNYVPERSEKEERLSKRCNIRSKVSREDDRSSGIRVEGDEVRSPWLIRDVITLEEDGVQNCSANTTKDIDGALQEEEEALEIVSRFALLKIGIPFESLIEDE
jgi:hypothetical protein